MPVINATTAINITIICQGVLPNAPVICPKYSLDSIFNISPVIEPFKKRNTQPTIIAYPMAMPREPIKGIAPNIAPPFFPLVFIAYS